MNAVSPYFADQPNATGSATVADWARFLKPVAAAVRNPPAEIDFRARCAAIAHAMPSVPAIWLAQTWRQREAMRRWQFWPAVADVEEWLRPEFSAERERADMTRRLAPPAPTDARLERPAEEIAAVSAKVRAFVAEVRECEAAERRPATDRPATLSEGALIEHYRRLAENGNQAAAFRVRAYEAAGGAHG